MKNSNLTFVLLENLLKKELKPIKDVLEAHTETLEASTETIVTFKMK